MMIRRRFVAALTGILAGNTVLFATQAIATEKTQSQNQVTDQYMVIDLAALSLPDQSVSEDVTVGSEEAQTEAASKQDVGESYLNLDAFFAGKNNLEYPDYSGSDLYAVTGIRAEEPIIAQFLEQQAGYDAYEAIELCEVTALQPADENGLYQLLLHQTNGVGIVHYSVAEDTLQKVMTEASETEDSESVCSLETDTNHWLIVHLVSKAVESDEANADNEALASESDELSSRSLEGDEDPDALKDTTTQDTAKADSTKPDEKTSSAKEQETVKPTETKSVTTTTKAPETKPASKPTTPTTSAPTTSAPTKAPETTKAPTTTPTTKAPETTAPTTTAHSHTWVPVTTTVHHDATYKTVWVQDQVAWDETVVTKEAWDEQVMVSAAWDETVYEWVHVCNVCGYVYPSNATWDDIDYHELIDPGCGGGWYDKQIPTGSIHHDAVYSTVHHDAETTTVHHDATGHNEQVIDQAAWDEQVTTGYKCSSCGATK